MNVVMKLQFLQDAEKFLTVYKKQLNPYEGLCFMEIVPRFVD